ncbi:hypothetical protein CCZ01_05380 [Helicobacter monodelphidis]|uniref:Mov34/MPN/PAD-1 family protein n=1 Tax=Helicobacter sp. 15-1451 TaxID=2004995 RepID=UPI000DCDD1B0|nr:M67 family metallopeptidase [Helicobacter sp. 15-1451]RAX57576.1 hypothetical protein CCZ01_05380 [Helicobacter sp. 15-1451]
MIKIPKDIYDTMIKDAIKEYPLEICGYLGGIAFDKEIQILKHFPISNIYKNETKFMMDSHEQFQAFKEAQHLRLRLLVCYHSHPKTSAYPSEEDIRLAFDENLNYMIISLKNRKKPIMKSYWIQKGKVKEQEWIAF